MTCEDGRRRCGRSSSSSCHTWVCSCTSSRRRQDAAARGGGGATASHAQFRQYVRVPLARPRAPPTRSPVSRTSAPEGLITDAEFEQAKAKALGSAWTSGRRGPPGATAHRHSTKQNQPLRYVDMSPPGWEDVERRHIILDGVASRGNEPARARRLFRLADQRGSPWSDPARSDGRARPLRHCADVRGPRCRALRHPILRAADALALVIPIFMVVFAWTYLTLARSDSDCVPTAAQSRVGALLHGDRVLDRRFR